MWRLTSMLTRLIIIYFWTFKYSLWIVNIVFGVIFSFFSYV